jgi:hypothetical protein
VIGNDITAAMKCTFAGSTIDPNSSVLTIKTATNQYRLPAPVRRRQRPEPARHAACGGGCTDGVDGKELPSSTTLSSSLVIEYSHQTVGSDGAKGFLADRRHFCPVDVTVEANTKPAPSSDVGRPKEPIGFGPRQLVLRARGRRTPEMWKVMVVMPVWPEHHELLPHVERRRAVTQSLGHPGQSQANPSHTISHAAASHEAAC